MPDYIYPQMPLEARTWYAVNGLPVPPVSDDLIPCSLSPVRPEDYFQTTGIAGVSLATHIIRCPVNPNIGDSILAQEGGTLFPCTVFEVPPGSNHLYACVWYHEVGAGFPNHHARIYVSRIFMAPPAGAAAFRGWI